MMGGYGGYGMGPGMMYGYGGYGPGAGMMGGYGADYLGALNLSADQREKITKIQEGLSTKHWELMGKMQQQQFQLRELMASGKGDDAADRQGVQKSGNAPPANVDRRRGRAEAGRRDAHQGAAGTIAARLGP